MNRLARSTRLRTHHNRSALSGCRQHPRGSHEVELAIHHLRAFG